MKINKNKFGNIGFLIIALFFAGLGIWGCCSQKQAQPNATENDAQYLNLQVQIVDKGGYAERNGKYTNVGKFFLVRAVNDTTLYTELNAQNLNVSCGCRRGIDYEWDSMYYNHKVGDILTFDYIRKNRFWHNYNYQSPVAAKPIIVVVHDSVYQPVFVKYFDFDGTYTGKMPVDNIVINYKKRTLTIWHDHQVAFHTQLKDMGITTMDKQP